MTPVATTPAPPPSGIRIPLASLTPESLYSLATVGALRLSPPPVPVELRETVRPGRAA